MIDTSGKQILRQIVFGVAVGWLWLHPGWPSGLFLGAAIAQDALPSQADATLSQAIPVPPLPRELPAAIAPQSSGIVGLSPGPEDILGIGHLRPKDVSFLNSQDWINSPLLEANWLQGVALPLYAEPRAEPGTEPWGWLINGWLIPNQTLPIAIGRDATFTMLHTYSALFTFPVLEIRPDGWFRFQYTPAGTAWAHRSHLNLGAIELKLETWQERFLAVGQVEFRKHGLSQPLRHEPRGDAPMVSLIGARSFMAPLAFEGDWMRVRVIQPADACTLLAGARTEEGWIRWRNDHQEPLVWYPPRGC